MLEAEIWAGPALCPQASGKSSLTLTFLPVALASPGPQLCQAWVEWMWVGWGGMPAQVTSPTCFPMSPHLLTYLDPGHPMPTGGAFAFLFNAFTVFPSFYLRGAYLKFSAYTEMKKIKVPHKPTSEVHHCSQFGYVSFYTYIFFVLCSFIHSFICLLVQCLLRNYYVL